MCITTDRSHSLISKIEGGQEVAGVIHERNKEATKAGVNMDRDTVFLSQLEIKNCMKDGTVP